MRAVNHLIPNAERSLHGFQVFHLQSRSILLTTSRANRLLALSSGLLVEINSKLRWSLKNMEELSERQIKKRKDHGNGMQLQRNT